MLKGIWHIVLSVTGFLWLLFTHCPPASATSYQQRINFEKAEDAFRRGHHHNYRRYKNKLLDYPLLPYLEYKELTRRIQHTDQQKISDFLLRYNSSPLADKLRLRWLKHSLRSQEERNFIAFYKPGLSQKLDCAYLFIALTEKPSDVGILDKIEALWLTEKSLPKACDPLLNLWSQKGHRSQKLIWERMTLAGNKGRMHLTEYLSRLLPRQEQYLGKLWRRLRQNPDKVRTHINSEVKSQKEYEIIAYALARLAWRKPLKAMKYWSEVENPAVFSKAQISKIVEAIGESLALKKKPYAATWLKALPEREKTLLIRELIMRFALIEGNWSEVLTQISKMDVSSQATDKWRYWQSRAYLELGQQDKARALLSVIAQERGYYGFLSAALLGQPGDLGHIPAFFPQFILNQLEKFETIARAKELYHLNRLVEARREWRMLPEQLPSEELLIAAGVVANAWGWHDRAIITLASAKYYDDVNIRFPTPYIDTIRNYSQKFSVSPSWTLAVARQESTFMADSMSGAGAMGLMQVLPTTAKAISRAYKLRYPGKRQLLKPVNNIKFGTAYLNRLLRYKQDNIVLAIASYNAGPSRVRQWRKHNRNLVEDVWIESIPYEETQRYVKNVLAYQYIYGKKLNSSNSGIAFIAKNIIESNVVRRNTALWANVNQPAEYAR